MPEYLAPGVYVEEIDTGSKPIEGVSTSTAGMLGVTERGPVNVPILITGVGEFTRWFGERLDARVFLDHCHLPHAVEGFFTNAGKRVFITRVLDLTRAERAETMLFDRGTLTSVTTRLLRRVPASIPAIIVAHGAGLAPNLWLQVGEGAETEYRRINGAPVTANEVALHLPLAFGHDPGVGPVAVDHFTGLGPVVASPQLDANVAPGDTQIRVSGAGPIAAGTLLRLGTTANGDEEYVIAAGVAPAAPAARVVTLQTPSLRAHPGGAGNLVDILPALGGPADSTTLNSPAAAGDSLILVANHTNFTTAGEFIRIGGATPHTEVRRIGQLGALTLTLPAYADYPAGAVVQVVTRLDTVGTNNKIMVADAPAGSRVLSLNDRVGLNVGDVVRVGQAVDVDVEYVTISAIPNRLPGPDAGKIALTTALQRSHPGDPVTGTEIREQTITRTPPAMPQIALPIERNSSELIVSDFSSIVAPAILSVTVAPGTVYYHGLGVAPTALAPAAVTLNTALTLPHLAAAPVAAREPLLLVQAIDPGAWGDRLRVSVQDHTVPLVNTRIRLDPAGIVNATHIRLASANGVETGTILQRVDAIGNYIDTPFKVIQVDRQNGYLLTLDPATPLPASAALGDAVRSREFQVDVSLLRQPDPAVPSRDEQILDSESFRYLSLDPRHSRYVQTIIGDINGALRLSDRRPEGESWYIRLSDITAGTGTRLGPEALVDVLPDGRRRPTRRALLGGDDSVGTLADATYIGIDDPNPENRTGLHSLRNIEEISIVACPGRISSPMQNALINHCELMRYRFAVLDAHGPPQDALADVQNQRQQFDTKYAALYHPWLTIPDPFPVSLAQVREYPIPPSGHILGVYARTDIERGVHKAPANEVVRGIVGLQRVLNKEQQDILNPYPVNINVIRDFRPNNRGIRVFGGRCITSDSDWKYVNVRRLIIFIEASIDRGLQWVVFEPNADPLWARVRRSITNFLTLVWRNGALEGTKVEEAFFVKCDRTTMTQTDIDQGRLICIVGVAPVKPAEFVIVRIGLWTAHAED